MAIDAIIGIASAVGDAFAAAAPEALAAGAAEAGGAAAAGEAGALALPEILVTPGVAGAEAAGGAALTGAEVAGGAAAAGGAGALGDVFGIGAAEAGALSPAEIVSGEFAALPSEGGPPVATEAITPGAGLGAGAGGVTTPTEALSGSTGPRAAFDTGGTTFDQLWAGTSTPGLSFSPEDVGATQPFAATTEPVFPPAGGAGGTIPQSVATALNAGQGGAAPFETFADLTPSGAPGVSEPLSMSLDTGATIGPGGVAAAPTAGAPTSLAAATTTAAPAAGAAAAPGAGGVTGTLSSILNSPWTRAAEIGAPLGVLGLTLARGQPSLPPAMQQALDQLGPTEALANQQLNAARTNTLTPAQAQQISTYKQNATNQLYQFYASQGRNPNQDTDFLQGVAQIEQNAVAMQQQFIDQMIKNGLAAQGAVSSELAAAANLQVQQDQAFQQSIAGALESFGLVAAISGSGRAAAPATA